MRCCPENKLSILRSNAKKIQFDAIKINMAAVYKLLEDVAKADGMPSDVQRLSWAKRFYPTKLAQTLTDLNQAESTLNELLLGPTQSS